MEVAVDGFAAVGAHGPLRAGSPVVPELGEAGGLSGLELGEVAEFGAVGGKIVELPRATPVGDEFQIAGDDGAMVVEMEKKLVMRRAGRAGEDRAKALARKRIEGVAGVGGGPRCTGDVDKRGHQVDEMGGLVGERAGLAEGGGPVGNAGGGTAAVGHVAFVVTEWSRAEMGPTEAVVEIAGAGGELGDGALGAAVEGAGAVIAEENDEGVFGLAEFGEFREDAADGVVHAINHRGVGGHAEIFEILLFGGERSPAGNRRGARRQRPLFFHDPEGELFLVALRAELVPAGEIFAAVFANILGPSLKGRVGRVEGQIEKERAVGLLAVRIGEEADGVVGVGVGGIEFSVRGRTKRLRVEVVRGVALKVVAGATEMAEVAVETAVDGVAIEMPFADGESRVAGGAENFAHRGAAFHAEAGVLPILAAHQRGAGGFALRGVVELGEAEAPRGKAIEMRRGDLAAVATEVGIPHVVGENENDVRTRG